MSAPSAIPGVKAGLLAAFQASAALTDTAVDVGIVDPRKNEMVEIFDATADREYGSLGRHVNYDEEVSVDVLVTVLRTSGSDLTVPEERMWELVDAVQRAFWEDLTLDGVWRFGRVSRVKQEYWREGKGRGSRARITFEGTARITNE